VHTTLEIAALSQILSTTMVHEALSAAGRLGQRRRRLPPELVFWLVVGMGLHRDQDIRTVLRRVSAWLGERMGWAPGERPHSTSITEARDRLGWEVFRTVFRALAARLDGLHGAAQLWHGMAVFALDGSTMRAPDTRANHSWFGGPRGGAWPQLRVMVLVSAYTHLVKEVVFGPYSMNEQKLAEHMLERIPVGAVLLLDRAFHSFVWPARFTARGTYFVVRAKTGTRVVKARLIRRLGKRDKLCALGSTYTRRMWPSLPAEVQVRVITRRINGHKIQVLTNLLSPIDYPADEIIQLYRDRWEAEIGLKELKTYLGNEEVVTFRSKRPDRVLQEAYGLLIAFNCVRGLMCEAARGVSLGPNQLSFTECLRATRELLPCAASQADRLHEQLVTAFSYCVLPPRRERSCPRAAKPRPFKYAVKRKGGPPGKTRRQKQRASAEQRRKAEAKRLAARRGLRAGRAGRAAGACR